MLFRQPYLVVIRPFRGACHTRGTAVKQVPTREAGLAHIAQWYPEPRTHDAWVIARKEF